MMPSSKTPKIYRMGLWKVQRKAIPSNESEAKLLNMPRHRTLYKSQVNLNNKMYEEKHKKSKEIQIH